MGRPDWVIGRNDWFMADEPGRWRLLLYCCRLPIPARLLAVAIPIVGKAVPLLPAPVIGTAVWPLTTDV